MLLSAPDLRGHTVLALHAHPDDEAIFTGITLRRLADAGARVVLVVATAGELGESRVPLDPGETLAGRRLAELERSAALLGVDRLVLLGRRDSGLGGSGAGHALAFAAAEPLATASRIAELADAEGAATLVYDDEHGIYGHPDHRAAHQVGAIAAELTGATSYRVTVDREHLRTAGHLVHRVATAAGVAFGRDVAEITLAVTGEAAHLATKHAAITAHVSQVGPEQLPDASKGGIAGFAAGYGCEWFVRDGAPGVLDLLGNTHPRSGRPGSVAAVGVVGMRS